MQADAAIDRPVRPAMTRSLFPMSRWSWGLLPVSIFNAVQFDLSPDLMALCTAVSAGVPLLMVLSSRLLGVERFFGSSHS